MQARASTDKGETAERSDASGGNSNACKEAWNALEAYEKDVQDKGLAILETVEHENRIAILVLNRPYHNDPGLNHMIPEEFQILGYPILSIRSIPKDPEWLRRFYKEDLDAGRIKSPLELNHVWPENYSANSAQKVWAADFAAHHPNVAVLDLSSFKCGHDAPTYGLIDTILQTARTPAAALHDLDANKPGGSIKIRVKTYAHSLRLQQERLEDIGAKKRQLGYAIDKKRLELLELKANQLQSMKQSDAGILQQLEEIRERVRAYEAPPEPSNEMPKGVVRLGKKTDDGRVVPVSAPQAIPAE